MKIETKSGEIINVFATYWIKNETYFYGIPFDYGGLIAYRDTEIVIVEPKLNFNTIFFKGQTNGYGIFHWALIEKNLLDDLLELDQNAYKYFLEIIKSENLVEPDFY
ncbi:hypothetical protein J3U57_12655 [Gilliamella sp. B3464]|uniref:hypothetical protein n=1 Tax=unclassified Gilliamella TaxID=2685620 RepID=UPI002269C769|nr:MULTISPECIES: hypothetical protein [unclassified Gilliamella]MCX8713360.1 hypothetical protein [Gilliamella sp. B3468]MCX8728742.1 hypothetical protein [Gilliamella sp. B2838]MCX8752421.1 hypothetical protein [Gilliamella sp. B3464]